MQVLFERERRACDEVEALLRDAQELGEMDQAFAETLLFGVVEKEDALKDAIQMHAPGWSLDRMDPIARCVLFVGAYELLFLKEAPPPVIMNEAIEIAKEYGTAESGKFVNGVLNAIAQGMGGGLRTKD
ncbi:MAG: N utilization substance protein B [Candidatus Peribacter riflensis]|uniref:Transcription antitermination protein NusB n=1 Tax=Candidatus Peribacter riflensis TaxID=1735162 RepID=A0A0S1SQZ1_9BACT|nr:MAG: N utilization substance protein B [Candidatus Peribacter riflensis]OGJ77294.1 MAG: transcription antitermination factor NusB [Candidatus Peribacteria bacterium RIFOXYB1_FULL_57_12]OGJ81993.1 MAG: transcription antitermination factor NusB [Candidatus Peribacteria bacterium RIFOXYC1_FULL_58_8]ALM10724.1 MAG: transcription termination protein NusB [Candidatus Peribacter riflensis]ALM11826.1 MAG: N utilization substance protein B [Candidatus Peribacter riflensis]